MLKVEDQKEVEAGWVNTATGPVEIPGSIKLHGQAGSCMINWTRCWYAYPSKDGQLDRIFWPGADQSELDASDCA